MSVSGMRFFNLIFSYHSSLICWKFLLATDSRCWGWNTRTRQSRGRKRKAGYTQSLWMLCGGTADLLGSGGWPEVLKGGKMVGAWKLLLIQHSSRSLLSCHFVMEEQWQITRDKRKYRSWWLFWLYLRNTWSTAWPANISAKIHVGKGKRIKLVG